MMMAGRSGVRSACQLGVIAAALTGSPQYSKIMFSSSVNMNSVKK
jgi:hypothetical protein